VNVNPSANQARATNGEYAQAARAETSTTLGRPFAGYTPQAVDELLAGLWQRRAKLDRSMTSKVHTARLYLGQRRSGGKFDGWATSPEDTLEALASSLASGTLEPYNVAVARRLLDEIDVLTATTDELAGEINELDDEFDARPWSRFFLVTSSAGGHVHSSRSCRTCKSSTEFGWLPQLSGKDEPEAVADQGAILCTACYPSAPVEWTRGKVDLDVCPGTGQRPAGEPYRAGRSWYGSCATCGKDLQVGAAGGVRKHKDPRAGS
jgi:hypothetical protein